MDDDLITTQFDQPARGLEDDAEIGTPTIDDAEPVDADPVSMEPGSEADEPKASPAPIPMTTPSEEQTPVLRYQTEAPRQAYRPPPNPPDYQPPGFDADAIHVTGTPGTIRDEASKVREGKVSTTQLKKEETLEHSWRQLLGDLDTTEFCHIKLWRRAPDNSYKRLGALYNTDISMVRGIERLIPYGTGTDVPARYVVEVAKGDVREDSAKGWRKFTFERIGPAPPPGWSLDSPYNILDQDVEDVPMAAVQQVVDEALRRFAQQNGIGGGTPQMQQNLNPHGGHQNQPDPMLMLRFEEERRERQRREEETRRREDEERKRIRDDEERLRRERQQAEEDRRKEREALQVQMQAVTAQVAAAEQRARDAEDRAKDRERELHVQRQFDATMGQINELKALVATNATRPPEKTSLDALLPVISTVVPVIGAVIQNGQATRAEEARNRMAQLEAESRQRASEAERLGQFVTSTAQQQLEYSRTMNDVLMKANDPSGTLAVAKMAGEGMMSNMTMIAQLAKSGLLGAGGGGGGGVNVGELIGQAVESLPQILALIMQMQERKAMTTASAMTEALQRPGLSGAMEAMYGPSGGEESDEEPPVAPTSRLVQPPLQPQQRPRQQPQQPQQQQQAQSQTKTPSTTRQPDPPPSSNAPVDPTTSISVEEAKRRKEEVRTKVRLMDTAAIEGGNPEILADAIFVLVQAIALYDFDKTPGGLQSFSRDLGIDPYSMLRHRYATLDANYIRAVVNVLIQKYGLEPQILENPDTEDEDADTIIQPATPATPATPAALATPTLPVVPRRKVTIKVQPKPPSPPIPPASTTAPPVTSAETGPPVEMPSTETVSIPQDMEAPITTTNVPPEVS